MAEKDSFPEEVDHVETNAVFYFVVSLQFFGGKYRRGSAHFFFKMFTRQSSFFCIKQTHLYKSK